MNAQTSPNGDTGTSLSNSSIPYSLTNDDTFHFLTTLMGDPVVHFSNVSSFTDDHDFYQQPQQLSATFEQLLSQQEQQMQQHQHAIHLSTGQSSLTDMKTDHTINNERHDQTELYRLQYQLQQNISPSGEPEMNSSIVVSNISSSQETNKDHAASANPSNPSNQRILYPSPSNQSNSITPGSLVHRMSFDSNSSGKRSKKGHLEMDSPFIKKVKNNNAITTMSQKSDHETEPTTSEALVTPTSNSHFTANSFQTMTRQQMVDRLIILENERIDLLRRLEYIGGNKDDSLVPATANNNDNNNLASSDMIDKNYKTVTGDDDDDDDDDDEGAPSEPSTANTTIDDFNSSTVEMKCLWKDCGISCVGGPGLTDHIIATHIGGGKSLYRCEWENCPRNQKPFTKRHKLCNHLRRHSGERPFVCDKAGCGKRFSRPDYLITHVKTHSNVRPFICQVPECGRSYYHLRSLKKHLKSHDDQKANEKDCSTFDSSNTGVNSTSYAPDIATTSTVMQPIQQRQPIYPFQEQLGLSQFVHQLASNATSSSSSPSSMYNKLLLNPSLYDPSHSLFNPLEFQDLSSIQTPPLPQQQFTQMHSTSHISMENTDTNADLLNQSNMSIQPQHQPQ